MDYEASVIIDSLKRVTKLIETIPAEAEIWEQVAIYSNEVDNLVRDKLEEHRNILEQKGLYISLNEKIDSLRNDLAGELAYHEIPLWEEWSAENISTLSKETVKQYSDALDNLREQLLTYKELRDRRTASISEEKALEIRMPGKYFFDHGSIESVVSKFSC